VGFVDVRHAAIALGREVERRTPERATVAWWKEERGGRVFLDFNQTARDRTVASTWSVRGTTRATVSTPLTWEQLTDWLAEHGDQHAAMDEHAFGLETLLAWYARDERDHGLGDLPYPPEHPKMAGEPKRVQPSKARSDT
jgi:DNA primase